MIGSFTCFGCSVRRSEAKNSFPKKLLVATSVLVVIAMCLVPGEARAVRMRHERRHEAAAAAAAAPARAAPAHEPRLLERRRVHRKQTLALTPKAERFKNATKKIIKKLKNTRRYFNEERRVLNETKEYRDGMPGWLPSINFVDIHFQNYRTPRRPGTTVTERKFMYLMPKLYKSLVEYHEIFKRLLVVEVQIPDGPFFTYNRTRHELLRKTQEHLYSTIAEVKENMAALGAEPPAPPARDLAALQGRLTAPQCLKNDYVAFRAYGNLLNNWYWEFRCPEGKKVNRENKQCRAHEARLREKKESRGKRRPSS